ncbi:MAG: FmdB family transcriptional regulator [Acidimicrobiaceae bacterium]|nr:FmdB family transcriptional regulator [Acidimicrobiaceae bacterium]
MPTYEYRCTVCGRMFERYQSFSDDPITVCPLPADGAALNGSTLVCSGEVRKVFSNVGISFKGSGFYRNDSRSEGRSTSKAPGNDSSDSSNSSTTSDSASKESASSDSNSSKASKDSSSSTVGAASASG